MGYSFFTPIPLRDAVTGGIEDIYSGRPEQRTAPAGGRRGLVEDAVDVRRLMVFGDPSTLKWRN